MPELSISEKYLKIFRTFESFQDLLLLDSDIDNQIKGFKEILKFFNIRDTSRRQLKFNIASLISIRSAIGRVPDEKLNDDLNKIKASMKEEFEKFKTFTGINNIEDIYNYKPVKETSKSKYITIDSFGDLDFQINNKKKKVEKVEVKAEVKFDEELDIELTANILKENLRKIKDLVSDNKDYYITEMPLLVNATTLKAIKFKRIGLEIKRTSCGTFWLNQKVLIVKRDILPTLGDVDILVSNYYKQQCHNQYSNRLKHSDIPDYVFLWFLPIQIMVELDDLKVEGYSLPFPQKVGNKASIEELRKLRLAMEAEKKAKKQKATLEAFDGN